MGRDFDMPYYQPLGKPLAVEPTVIQRLEVLGVLEGCSLLETNEQLVPPPFCLVRMGAALRSSGKVAIRHNSRHGPADVPGGKMNVIFTV